MLNRRWKCITLLVLSCVPWSELLAVLRGSLLFRAEKLNRSTVSPQVSFGLSRDQLDLQGPLSYRCNLHSSKRLCLNFLTFNASLSPSIPTLPSSLLLARMACQKHPGCQACHLPVSQQARVLSRLFCFS